MSVTRFRAMEPGWYEVLIRHKPGMFLGYVGRTSQFLWQPFDDEGNEIGKPTYSRKVAAEIVYARAYNTYREDPANN